jgi:hypothetical protein
MPKLDVTITPELHKKIASGEALFLGIMILYPNEDQLRYQFSAAFPIEEATAMLERYGIKTAVLS